MAGASKCICNEDSDCAYYVDADAVIAALLSAPESIRLELAGMLMAPGLDAVAMVKAALSAPPSEVKP